MYVSNSSQIRSSDQIQINDFHTPGILLMENAGRNCAGWILNRYRSEKQFAILAGPGNNGGDGLVIARYLHQAGKQVHIFLSHEIARYQGDAKIAYEMLQHLDVKIELYTQERAIQYLNSLDQKPVLIDALLGTGIKNKLYGKVAEMIFFWSSKDLPCVAIDMPSGIDADTGNLLNACIQAKYTLSLQLLKLCHVITPASLSCGDVSIIDVGIWNEVIERLAIRRHAVDRDYIRKIYKNRGKSTHKGTHGHALLIGGSQKYTGAIALTAMGCLRAGVGLCTVISPTSAIDIPRQLCPEAICIGLGVANDSQLNADMVDEAIKHLHGKRVVCIGPGMGRGEDSYQFLKNFLPHVNVPLVLDADALNIISVHEDLRQYLKDAIITPHPGEMKRLFPESDAVNFRLETAESFAKQENCILLLKGAGSIIAAPGGNTWINSTGNPGMASGGSGDVLAGMISAWLAQGYDKIEACLLGAYFHGLAADLFVREHHEENLLARDIANFVGKAISNTVSPNPSVE